ncbi:MAG: Tol-Pal system protein TolB [Pseudomonadota bacterium]
MTRTLLKGLLAALTGFCLAHGALAQSSLRIDITTSGDKLIPIALLNMPADNPADRVFVETVETVVAANLRRTGAFSLLPVAPQNPPLTERTELSNVFAMQWQASGAHAVTLGSLTRLPDGRVDLRFRLIDTTKNVDLGGLSLVSDATNLDARRTAHRMADYIFEKLTGEPGFFSTRLAYVRREGKQQVLLIADSDGENAQPALRSNESIISLAWSPDGKRLAYVSFETGKAVVYVHELATGKRSVVANYRGSNSSPAWSPDGNRLAVVLTKDGGSQIYTANPDGSGLKRITRTGTINTEPSFSADGRHIYFTSDRGGSAQIYRTTVDGSGQPERISFQGRFNARPVVSPNGQFMSFVAQRDGRFVIGVRELASGDEILVSDGPKDDSPSFAPNSKWIIFSSRINGREALSAVSVDGKVRTRISLDTAGIRNPAWGQMPR